MYEFPKGIGSDRLLKLAVQPEVFQVGYNDFRYMLPEKNSWIQKHYTLHFVLRGSGFLEMGGQKYSIGCHDYFVIPPDTPMMYYPNENDKWAYVWFCVKGSGAQALFESIGADVKNPVLHRENSALTETILESLFQNGKFADDYRVLSVFYEVLHCIGKPLKSNSATVKLMIDRNFQMKDFTITQLCRNCGQSHAQLCRNYQIAYGISPKQYLITKRMGYARELLRGTDLTIGSIADSCGYSDSVHFMKEFKRREGITPSEYRRLGNTENTDFKTAEKG